MATKKIVNAEEKKTVVEPTIKEKAIEKKVELSIGTAKRIYELYNNIEAADAHFQTCQSVNFRQHMQSVYKARNIANAFEELNEKIVECEKE